MENVRIPCIGNLIQTPKVSIVFNSNDSKQIGKFYENEDGKLEFEGNLTESGLKFVEFIKKTYNKEA